MRNKFLTKILGATLGLAMAIGVGVGVAANNRAATMLDAATSTGSASFNFGTAANVSGRWAAGKGSSTANSNSSVATAWAAPNPDSGEHTYTDTMANADANGQKWTVTYTYTGAYSVSYTGGAAGTANMQFGKKSNPPTTLTIVSSAFTQAMTLSSFSCKYGDASNASTVKGSLYYDSTLIVAGAKTSSSSTETKTVSYTAGTLVIPAGSSLKVAFSDMANGMKVYEVSYTLAAATVPTVSVNKESVFFRIGASGQTVTATSNNFSGDVSYSWQHQSGTDCVDLENASSATVTMTPKNGITEYSAGVYRVTATCNTESATADVSVVVDRGNSENPYSVSEARAAVDREKGLENAYVKGFVYQVDSYSEKYHSITYWISDDCTDSSPLQVYGGLGISGANFSSISDIQISDVVVVTGTLTKYSSTYEFNSNNELVSKASVESIAVKTAPTKVAYNSSEFFDPTGLVVTATYSDSSTKDYSYAQFASSFTFDPATTTALTTQDSVTITLFGQTTTQSISVTSRTIVGVTLMGDMTKKTYNDGDSWDLSGLYLSIEWSNGTPNPTSVNLADVNPSDYDLDPASPTRGVTSLYIYGIYEGEEIEKTVTGITVNRRPIEDLLRTASTSFNLTKTSYNDFSNKRKTLADLNSEATWAGTAACNTSKNNALQLNGTSRGIYTTASSQYVKSVAVNFNDHNDCSLYFYASNTAYTAINASVASDENSTLVATLNKDTLSANIVGNYKYLYIYSSGAIYMNSITVTWKFATEAVETVNTRSSLAYSATKNGENDFTFSNVYLRFGGIVSESFWDQLHTESTITSYGVLFSTNEYLGVDELKSKYNEVDGTNVKKFSNTYDPLSAEPNKSPKLYEDSTYQGVEDNYYVWNLRYTVAEANYTRVYAAVAFIVTESDGVVFLGEVRKSAKNVAADMIAGPDYDASSAEGSLNYLANLAGEL